ncbi:GNAT family N-acetyltransferase [Micromonospora tulbaghiae]|uniref:GNAT family N-acetyltransferase n=1 Tax=Micromonospora tulbaghiae TaxID=479978 RepID=UPI003326A4E9
MPTTDTTRTIRRATADDAPALLPVLVDAFMPGPVAEWLVPDETERRFVYYRYFRLALRLALEHGQVYTTGDRTGVAIWYLRDGSEPTPPPHYDHDLEYAAGKYTPRFKKLDQLFEAHHPPIPHRYLAYLAVGPAHQGLGIGTALLEHAHRELDGSNEVAYLEASNANNERLYSRQGWRGTAPMYLPQSGPPIRPMWRSPRPSAHVPQEQ